MKLRALLNPEYIPYLTAEQQALADFAVRVNWHQIFDTAPNLETLSGNMASGLLRDFLSHCDKQNIPLDWLKHVRLLEWLEKHGTYKAFFNQMIKLECLIATASSWAANFYQDMGTNRLVLSEMHTTLAIGVTRPLDFLERPKIMKLQLAAGGPTGSTQFLYGTTKSRESWHIDTWSSI